jgi:hypothetical protein
MIRISGQILKRWTKFESHFQIDLACLAANTTSEISRKANYPGPS